MLQSDFKLLIAEAKTILDRLNEEELEHSKDSLGGISEFVRKKRKESKLTQEEFAKKAGVGLRFIRELEGGKPTVRLDVVNKVLAIFGAELSPVNKKA